jgi:hypothetical protein
MKLYESDTVKKKKDAFMLELACKCWSLWVHSNRYSSLQNLLGCCCDHCPGNGRLIQYF